MTNFHSVGTGAARLQNISPNPQKLAGQCAKLKCCLNYEMDVYEEAVSYLPDRNIPLETLDGTWYFFSADPLAGEVTYSSDCQFFYASFLYSVQDRFQEHVLSEIIIN